MKKIKLLLAFVLLTISSYSQTWTAEQLALANTAKDASFLSEVEKEAIQYINLARLYPKLYAKFEVQNYTGPEEFGDYLKNSKYKKSLITKLNVMKPVGVLTPEIELFESAKCFAKESGELGLEGHKRKNCADRNYAECCSYGMSAGKDIAMQWLIDHNTASLGHRTICLNGTYTKTGISVHPHKKWEVCAVAEFQ